MGRAVIGLAIIAAVVGLTFAVMSLNKDGSSTEASSVPPSGFDRDTASQVVAGQNAQDCAAQQYSIFVQSWIPKSVDDLAKAAHLVVVGTVEDTGEPQLAPIEGAPAGQKRFRDHTVRVDRTLKGEAGSTIVLRQLMSLVYNYEAAFPDVLPFTDGDTYLLFLKPVSPGVWGVVENPYRYHLVDGQAIPEMGCAAAAALGEQLDEIFPATSEALLLERLEQVTTAFPNAVSIAALQGIDGASPVEVEFPAPGDIVNITESLGLSVQTALAIERGVTFK